MGLAKYMEQKVWQPLGMENDATWSLDDKRHRSAKAFGGLNATAIDLAKIGRLYINKGNWEGKQIVSNNWIKETLTPNINNDGYQNQWYSLSASGLDSLNNSYFNDSITPQKLWESDYDEKYPYYETIKIKKTDYHKKHREKHWKFDADYKWRLKLYTQQYYALGIMQQLLFIDPAKNLIVVRLGENGDYNYKSLMYRICKSL